MWLEHMLAQLSDLPSKTSTELAEMRKRDRASRDLLDALSKEEEELIQEVKKAGKQDAENRKGFDEELFFTKAKQLIAKRAEVTKMLEERGKHTQDVYDILDGRIASFDSKTEAIKHLMVYDPNDTLAKRKKKKRKEEETRDSGSVVVDPNEPVYCTCKTLSVGSMTCCDGGDDCEVGWFHNKCVGLPENPTDDPSLAPDLWYCDTCRARLGVGVEDSLT